MGKYYNRSVNDVFEDEFPGWRKYAGEYGIEIEVEGEGLPVVIQETYNSAYWKDIADNSLRGESREYILKKPVLKKDVKEALDELKTIFQKAETSIKDSVTTSVHVHMNCQKLSMREVSSIAVTYYILEHLLIEYCGEEREGNKFCLRGQDAEDLVEYLVSCLRRNRLFDLRDDRYRYAGLNYTALPKYGSLEFRGMRGLTDLDEINRWVDILDNIKKFSLQYEKPSDIIGLFSHTNALGFIQRVLPSHWTMFAGMTLFERRVLDGVRLAQDLAFCIPWELDPPEANITREPEKKIVKKKVKSFLERPPELLRRPPRPIQEVDALVDPPLGEGPIGPGIGLNNNLNGRWGAPNPAEQQRRIDEAINRILNERRQANNGG